jgi:hypothetical protein
VKAVPRQLVVVGNEPTEILASLVFAFDSFVAFGTFGTFVVFVAFVCSKCNPVPAGPRAKGQCPGRHRGLDARCGSKRVAGASADSWSDELVKSSVGSDFFRTRGVVFAAVRKVLSEMHNMVRDIV